MGFKYDPSLELEPTIVAAASPFGGNQIGIDPAAQVASLSFTYPNSMALSFIGSGMCGLLSVCAITGLFAYIGIKAMSGSHTGRASTAFFFKNPLGLVLMSLFVTDLLGGLSWTMQLRWAATKIQDHGSACIFQGVSEQIGSLGAAIWNLLLAVLTFGVLVMSWRIDNRVVWALIGSGWAFIVAVIVAAPLEFHLKGYPAERFYGPSNTWCWMGGNGDLTKKYILLTEVVCVISAVVSLSLYTLIYLRLSGRLRLDGSRISLNWQGKSSHNTDTKISSGGPTTVGAPRGGATTGGVSQVESIGKQVIAICKKLLFYPLVYCVIITPIAACRLFFFTHPFSSGVFVPWQLNQTAGSIEALSGLCNTVLFIFTRHSLVIRPENKPTGIHITTTRFVATDDDRYGGQERSNNFNLRSMTTTKKIAKTSNGSDEDLQKDFEQGNAQAESLRYNSSSTTLPQSTNGAESELELGREPLKEAEQYNR
ncbi:hypothetical protein BDY24DRAFT_441520 [Mrakia frigida]|uniref:uncharacterized protein n=1 Tax=Mrakia frigida TaxID=29902 RepID=UPI003FCC0A65